MDSAEIVRQLAVRYGSLDYDGAITYFHAHEADLDDVALVPALLQAFYSARDAGRTADAQLFAQRIAVEHPDMPSIQKFL